MSRIDFVDKEILGFMKNAGCHQIGYGIESASLEILKNMGKPPSSLNSAERIINLTKKSGIDVRAMFMLGSPGETENTLRQTIDFAIRLKPDLAIFNITTPFPGTAMYTWAKESGYLMNLDWDKYDAANVVMHLPTVSPEKVKYYYCLAYRRFYFRPYYILKRLLKIKSLVDLKNNAKSLLSILAFETEK